MDRHRSLAAQGKRDCASALMRRMRRCVIICAHWYELVEKLRKEGKAETTLSKKEWLIDMANNAFGEMPSREVTPPIVLQLLKAVEAKGNYETAKRLRSTIGQVFRFAIATARAETESTYALRGAIIATQATHMAAATSKEDFARVVQAIWVYEAGSPTTRAALKLLALLYPRPGELRLALWDEFDLEAATWTILARRAKMRRAYHRSGYWDERVRMADWWAGEILKLLSGCCPADSIRESPLIRPDVV